MPGNAPTKPSDATEPTEPTDAAHPTEPSPPQLPEPPAAPPPTRSYVEKHDVQILLGVSVASLAILSAFFWIVFYNSDLLKFPLRDAPGNPATYFTDALEFRERRTALALMLRSFITGFSFVVGLALATMGGIFILRQVTALTALNLTPGAAPADTETPEGLRSWLKATQFSFQSYSPGVVFMLGGLGIIAITQWTALPTRTPEVSPVGAFVCWDEDTSMYLECKALAQARKPTTAEAGAQGSPPPAQGGAAESPAAASTQPAASFDTRCAPDAADRPAFCPPQPTAKDDD